MRVKLDLPIQLERLFTESGHDNGPRRGNGWRDGFCRIADCADFEAGGVLEPDGLIETRIRE